MRAVFAEILQELKAAGYRVTARLIDASYLGVPQMRKRMIFVGVRGDLGAAPVHPAPAGRLVTVRQAWAGLDGPGLHEMPCGKTLTLARITTPGAGGASALEQRGGRRYGFSLQRLHWDRPAFTVTKTVRPAHASGLLHPAEDRFIGVRELTRLQSFPDEYDWGDGTYKQIHARIGNSVPPLMMRAVAAEIRAKILRPERVLEDGTTEPVSFTA
jgi:DNA (cytosine-5)-methyltransferase 1